MQRTLVLIANEIGILLMRRTQNRSSWQIQERNHLYHVYNTGLIHPQCYCVS